VVNHKEALQLISKGVTFMIINKPDHSIGCYYKALEISRTQSRIYNYIGIANTLIGENERALSAFSLAI
jgi:lipoprotein NlpI